MGFLESAGRSGAIGRFGDTMFQNALAVSENQRQNEAMALQAQEMATKQKLIDAKLAEEERKNRPKLLSELVGAGTEKGKPNTMKLWSEAAKIYGKKITLPDGKEDYTVTENDIPNIQKHLETQKDLHPQVMWAQYQDNLLSLQTREKERAKIKTAPELQAFDDETERMKAENAGILTEFGKGGDEKGFTLSEGQTRFSPSGEAIASGGAKAITPAWKESPDPESPTGFSYVDQNSGKKGSPAPPPKSAVEINFDKETIKGVIKQLPKMKDKAQNSSRGIQRIDQMIGLLERGAGGRMGQIKAWLAPTLEAVGVKSKGLSDAQLYETLARTLGGSFRMEIVGPGQVSDYENRLLQAISGGGGTATDAARELLNYYKGIAESNISDYNDAVGAVSDASPAAAKVYPAIGGGAQSLPQGTVDNGDGTYTLPTGQKIRKKR